MSAELLMFGVSTARAAYSGVSKTREAVNDHGEAPSSPVHGSLLDLLPFIVRSA